MICENRARKSKEEAQWQLLIVWSLIRIPSHSIGSFLEVWLLPMPFLALVFSFSTCDRCSCNFSCGGGEGCTLFHAIWCPFPARFRDLSFYRASYWFVLKRAGSRSRVVITIPMLCAWFRCLLWGISMLLPVVNPIWFVPAYKDRMNGRSAILVLVSGITFMFLSPFLSPLGHHANIFTLSGFCSWIILICELKYSEIMFVIWSEGYLSITLPWTTWHKQYFLWQEN